MEAPLEQYGHCLLLHDLGRICIDKDLTFEMSLDEAFSRDRCIYTTSFSPYLLKIF
jgi:hypothetical protein